MASSVEELSLHDKFIWECQTNDNPWDATQTAQWAPYSNTISSAIEDAYKRGFKDITIDEKYLINFKHYIQQRINDPNRQRPVRRCRRPSTISTDTETEEESSLQERLSFPLGVVSHCSASGDTTFYGSPFVHVWLMNFTYGKMKITFDTIYPILVKGLLKEGQTETRKKFSEIKLALSEVEEKTDGKSSEERIKQLQICCAKLYTKDCYIYHIVNSTLRDDDRTKLHTLGPFCYLLFDYIGQRFKDKSSIGERFRQVFHPNKIQSITLYRGDRNINNIVEEYRQAAGDDSKYFKWLPFVSTSRDRDAAEKFGVDILYIIEIRSYSSKSDQFSDLEAISDHKNEIEILLLPGIIFQVKQLDFDNKTGRHLVYIKIKSSYISKL